MLNVKSMTLDKLLVARGKIDTEIELRSVKERSQLIEAIGQLRTAATQKPATALHARPHALKGKKLPALYRNPKNRNETWAGRGNRPRWLVAALKGGKKLEAFAIR
jgi:DNA-binding protein H-NS